MNSIAELPSNKLKVYLIKEKYQDFNSLIKNDSSIKKIELDEGDVFYYKKSFPKSPQWLDSFFLNNPAIDENQFSSSGTCALLLTQVNYKGKIRIFAIPFGAGRYMLKELSTENRFGLITTLNILEANSIRSIGKTTLSSNPKMSVEQISKASGANDFQINIERDIVESITGTSTFQDFGKMITGKDALSITAKVNVTNLKKFLIKALTIYHKTDYKKDFKWIDQIKEIKDEVIIDTLNQTLVDGINNYSIDVWLGVPEIIEWDDFFGFKYSTRKTDDLHDELNFEVYLKDKTPGAVTFDDLDNDVVSYWRETKDTYIRTWNVYHCINAEVDYKNEKYLLDKSRWYKIESAFVKEVEKEIKSIKRYPKPFPDYNHKNENDYNLTLSSHLSALCLDAKNLTYGGGSSKIEVCDVFTLKKEFLHIKKYGGSSTLSHLFAQGFVSAELFVTDTNFRNNVRKKLLIGTPYEHLCPPLRPNTMEYSIVYGVITPSKKELNIPFFSKVNLKNFKRQLEGFGYNVFITKILNVKGKTAPPKKASKRKSKTNP